MLLERSRPAAAQRFLANRLLDVELENCGIMTDHAPNPMHEVQDQETWLIFESFLGGLSRDLPSFMLFGHKFQLTKFMILELLAALLIIAIFVPLARRARDGSLPRGPWWNAFESLLTFIRN